MLGAQVQEVLLLASTDGVPVTNTGGRALPILHTGQRLHVIPYVWNTGTLAFEPQEKGGAGGGDASAANQATEIARLEAIRDRLPTVLSGDRLKVELPAGGGGLTDAELRATAVPVSGPLTDAQLRAVAVPVSAAALPLPAGAATFAQQDLIIDGIDALLLELANKTEPADIQNVDTGTDITTPVPAMPAGGVGVRGWLSAIWTKLNASLAVTGTFWQATQPVSGPLTDAQLRATAVPVSGPLTDAQLRATAVPVSQAVIPTAGGKTITYVPVAQGAAGTTVLAAADAAKKHKVLGCVLTMSADGTLKFTDTGDLTGAMDIAAKGGFVLPTSPYPFLETGAVNRALNLVTTVGLAKGVVAILTEA